MRSGFDLLASSYDSLAYLIFGRSIRISQCAFINEIDDEANILILGGGTGWILNEIFEKKPKVRITFVDNSSAMIDKAKSTVKKQWIDNVNFIQGTYHSMILRKKYNVIFTAFFLDMFPQDELEKLMHDISNLHEEKGVWLFTDFKITNNVFQQLLLKVMYLFFVLTCKIEAKGLSDFEAAFHKNQYRLKTSKLFFRGMIESKVYYR